MLKADRVDEIFRDCLFQQEELVDGKPPEGFVEVPMIMHRTALHPERLESHREEVQNLLLELPDEFRSNAGGGWSFLNACNDRHDRLWTGEHRSMDQLFGLGIGLGIVKYLMEREMWSALPGGMPYIAILMDKFVETERIMKEETR